MNTDSNILVSIVTPSYNQGKYIEETIKSVLNQTYNNIEYIIVDGQSDDETVEILNKYSNLKNVRIIIEKDNGQSDAINKGFKIARGDLVGWINSDDLLDKECISKVVEEYKKNKDAAIFYGDIEVINDRGEHLMYIKANNVDYHYLLHVNPNVTQPGSFYNSEYVRKIGYLDEKIHYTMDYDLWLRLLREKNKAIRINAVLAKFRFQNNSKTIGRGNALKFWKDIYYIRRKKHHARLISLLDLYFIVWCIKAILKKLGKYFGVVKNI